MTILWRFNAIVCLLVVAFGCAGGGEDPHDLVPSIPITPQANDRPLLFAETAGDDAIRLSLTGLTKPGPRMIELWLNISNVAELVASSPGTALEDSGKEFVIQDKGNGLFRAIAFSSSNVNSIGSGELAVVALRRASPGTMRVEILTDRPMFAPQEAQQGLIVGDPIEL
jgi:hypothetical protein